jgi:hypothetical protein
MQQFVVGSFRPTLHVKLESMTLAIRLAFGVFNLGGFMIHVKNFFRKLCTIIFVRPLNCSTFGLLLFCSHM